MSSTDNILVHLKKGLFNVFYTRALSIVRRLIFILKTHAVSYFNFVKPWLLEIKSL